jgi:hypothetical protein
MLSGNVSLSFNIWILVNSQTGSVPPRDQRILTIGNKFHLTLVITDNDLYGLSFGIESVMGERQERILKPDTWYNVTGTRNVLTDMYEMYVDNVIIKGATNNRVVDIDKTIRLAHHNYSGVNTDDFQIGQIGTLNIFEKALSQVEIEDLHYLYNVRYLLKNSVLDCRISENFDPDNLLVVPGTTWNAIPTSSFRYSDPLDVNNNNIMLLFTDKNYDNFDGKSFLLDKNSPTFWQNLNRFYLKGFTDVQFQHTFNCFFKLSPDATLTQDILGYGSAFDAGSGQYSHVRFEFTQTGDTDQFTPRIFTYLNTSIADQNFYPSTNITRDVWYFYSFQRDTVSKTMKLSVNGGSFQSQSYTDEMTIQTDRIGIGLGAINIRPLGYLVCKASFGNFSLFNRNLSLKEVKSIFDLDKDLYGPAVITPQTIDRRIRPSFKTGITTEFNFKESVKSDVSDITIDGTIFIYNDGFIEVVGGTYMEVVKPLPSYILEPDNNHSWVIQFRALSVTSGPRMIVTSIPSSVEYATDFSGFTIFVTDTSVRIEYEKAPNVILVSARYAYSEDLSIGVH